MIHNTNNADHLSHIVRKVDLSHYCITSGGTERHYLTWTHMRKLTI